MGRHLAKRMLHLFVFIVAYLILFAYCLIFNNDAGWSLWFFLTLILLFDLLSLLPSLKKVQVTIEESLQSEEGTTLSLPLEIFCYRPLFFPFVVLSVSFDDGFHQQTLPFYRGAAIRTHAQWTPPQRGRYDTFPATLRSGDLFGFIEKKRSITIKQSLLVLPAYQAAATALLPLITEQPQRYTYGEPTFTIKQFRSYRPGDSLKYIDWKLSSKQQALIFREPENQQTQTRTLIFWGEADEAFEATLSLFFSLHQLIQTQHDVQFLLFGADIPSPYHPDALAYAQITPFDELPAGIPSLAGRQVLVIAPAATEQVQRYIDQLQRHNSCQLLTYADLLTTMAEEETT